MSTTQVPAFRIHRRPAAADRDHGQAGLATAATTWVIDRRTTPIAPSRCGAGRLNFGDRRISNPPSSSQARSRRGAQQPEEVPGPTPGTSGAPPVSGGYRDRPVRPGSVTSPPRSGGSRGPWRSPYPAPGRPRTSVPSRRARKLVAAETLPLVFIVGSAFHRRSIVGTIPRPRICATLVKLFNRMDQTNLVKQQQDGGRNPHEDWNSQIDRRPGRHRPRPAALVTANAPAADTVFRNGTVITIDRAQPKAQAVAVGRPHRLCRVRPRSRQGIGKGTRVVNLKGRTMMPGPGRRHSHPLGGGDILDDCDLGNIGSHGRRHAGTSCAISDAADPAASNSDWLQVSNWSPVGVLPAGTVGDQSRSRRCLPRTGRSTSRVRTHNHG